MEENKLHNFELSEFFRDNWQKKPLFIKKAVKFAQAPISPDDLASLALEEDLTSRVVKKVTNETTSYQLEHGPFTETSFQKFGESNWMLLVQEVDQWVDEVSKLRDLFTMIPDWRVDDCMVSYSTDGGTVGPHMDQYDVFLVQGAGVKIWRIENKKREIYENEGEHILDNPDLKILRNFRESTEFKMEEGDMLYIPSGHAHHGVSVGESVTYSIGLTMPSIKEMLVDYFEGILENVHDDLRLGDSNAVYGGRRGEIPSNVWKNFENWPKRLPSLDKSMLTWFGPIITRGQRNQFEPMESLTEEQFEVISKQLLENLEEDLPLYKNSASRCAYFIDEDEILFFMNGERFKLSLEYLDFVIMLSEESVYESSKLLSFLKIPNFNYFILGLLFNEYILFDER
jgi:50S ribosomal protein L16 3-hydroxylase